MLCEVNFIIMSVRIEGFGIINFRVIFVDFLVFVSQNCGFGMVLKKLFFGGKYVIRLNKFEVWVERIKEVLENSLEDLMLEVKKFREEYEEKYCWQKQCDDFVERMFIMFLSK